MEHRNTERTNGSRPHLDLISHARTPPLTGYGEIHLRYDCRDVANPPKAMRDKLTGLHKPLREHLLSSVSFVKMLDSAEADIKRVMEQFMADHGAAANRLDHITARHACPGEDSIEMDSRGTAIAETPGESGLGGEQEECLRSSDAEEMEDEQYGDHYADASEEPAEPVLRVSAFCARGHHRSVAFVEELARRAWPTEWGVKVVHRDVHKRHPDATVKQKRSKFRDKTYLRDEE